MTDRQITRRRIDWEAIERDYRTGKFSLRELEARHGAGYADISRRAKKFSWSRDLREAVRLATSAALIRQIATDVATEAQQSTAAVVLAAGEVNALVLHRHRQDAVRSSELIMRMLKELETVTLRADELSRLFDLLHAGCPPSELSALRARFANLMTLNGRVTSIQKLVDALVKLQAAERKAHSLDEDVGDRHVAGDELWAALEADAG